MRSCITGGSLYALNGPEPFGAVTGRSTQGLVIDIDTGVVSFCDNELSA